MKRLLGAIALIGLTVLLIGCSAANGDTNQVSQPTAPTEALPPADTLLPTSPPTAAAQPTETSPAVGTPAPPATSVPTVRPAAILSSDDVYRISPAEARALVDGGVAVLYDTRTLDEYLAGHLAGAVSFPEAEAALRYRELPAGQALIFYCT